MVRPGAFSTVALLAVVACSGGDDPQTLDAASNNSDAAATCSDGDGDGVCDADDVCNGFDDNVDSDGDGFPDSCQPTLSTLEVTYGSLVPEFTPLVTEYTVDVRVEVQTVEVTPIATVPSEVTIRVNGTPTQSGAPQSIPLALGPNIVHVHLMADSGGERTYDININRVIGIVQQAYVKASNTGYGDTFGVGVALDGDTLVVAAAGEASSATGVDADQTDNSADSAGAVYVFVRDGSTWTQQAYLKPSNTDAGDQFGVGLAIDGDTIAVGARCEDSSATGVGADQSDETAACAGAVYVFVRSGSTWTQQAYVIRVQRN